MADKFLEGWQAAREVWQRMGSVPPYPPDVERQRRRDSQRVPGAAPTPKKRAAKRGE